MTWPTLRLLFWQGLFLTVLLPLAGKTTAGLGHYPTRSFGFSEGLTNTSVICLGQASDGLMYAGTEGGLFRFDGRRFESAGLPDQYQFVTTLQAGTGGRLWVGTRNGLGYLDASRAFHGGVGPLHERIHSLGLDARGELWIHAGEQLLVFAGGAFAAAPRNPEAPAIIAAFADPATPGVAVLAAQGIWTLDPARRTWSLDRMPLNGGDVPLAFGRDGEGFTWVRTRLATWRKAPGQAAWTRLGGPLSQPVPDHLGITRDQEGWLWITTEKALMRCKGLAMQPVHGGPRGDVPVTGLVDREHSIWLASLGVTQVLGRTLWTVHDMEDGLPNNVAWTTVRDRLGRLWAATDGGLAVMEPGGWKVVAKGQFSRVRLHPDGTILAVGSPGGTLYSVAPGTLQVTSNAAPCMPVTAVSRGLGVEPDGTVWISDYRDGFAQGTKTGGRWTWKTGTVDGHRPKGIFEVVQDTTGAIYLPTAATVYLRDQGRWESLGATLPFTPLGAQRTGDDEIWVAYLDRPVLTRHARTGSAWKQVEEWWPFPNKAQILVFSLAATPAGQLWVGTSQGLGRLKLATRSLENWFAPGEGLPGADATTQGLALEPDGSLWFGTSSGLGCLSTANPLPAPGLPAPLLLAWSVRGQALPLSGAPPALEPRADLELRLALPSFLYASTLGLEARLTGVDRDWVPLDGTHLRYPSLASGAYRLEVRLRREGAPPGPALTLGFRVRPSWWETWWARCLFVLSAAGASYGAFVLRGRSLQKTNLALQERVEAQTRELREANEGLTQANQLKSRFLATAAHDLKNPLAGVLLMAELIEEEAGDSRPAIAARARRLEEVGQKMLLIITSLLETAAQEIRDVTLHLEESNLPSLVHQVVTANLEYAHSKEIRLTYQELLAGECWGFVDEVHFRQAVDNLVNNAIKYSPPGQEVLVTLSPRMLDGLTWVTIQVEDHGPGLTPEDKEQAFGMFQRLSAKPTGGEYSTGLGLSIVKQMVELHGGRVWIESAHGHGSTFCMQIPLRTANYHA